MIATKMSVLLEGVAETAFPDLMVDMITTDSRTVEPGSVYIAIIGERFDGNDFEGHEPDEQIVGFFPESSKMKFEKRKGRT